LSGWVSEGNRLFQRDAAAARGPQTGLDREVREAGKRNRVIRLFPFELRAMGRVTVTIKLTNQADLVLPRHKFLKGAP
jgi:hypothetical protein